jgi:murein hydrolase activator
MRLSIALVLVLWAGTAWAVTEPPRRIDQMQTTIKKVERDLDAQRARQQDLQQDHQKLSADITRFQTALVKAAARAQDQEEALSKLEDSLVDLENKAKQANAKLEQNHDALSHILGALLRLKRQPPQALLAIPQTPLETAHSIVLLRTMLPELQTRIDALQAQLDDIKTTEARIAERKAEIGKKRAQMIAERKKLDRLLTDRQQQQSQNQKEQAALESRIRELADRAGDLRDLITKLEAERKAREAAPKKSARASRKPTGEISAVAGVKLPAKGKLLTNYGEKNALGVDSKGLVIQTRPGAQVISPYAGEIVYAGNFRSYGLILIIATGDGYHIMLSNLGRIDAVLGKNVVAGEPVGQMPATASPPELYVEYRKGGQAVSPRVWAGPDNS